jgi:hypothetical protein
MNPAVLRMCLLLPARETSDLIRTDPAAAAADLNATLFRPAISKPLQLCRIEGFETPAGAEPVSIIRVSP